VWAHSGRELFFVDVAGRLVSVSIAPGPSFQAGAPTALFSLDNIVLPPYHLAFSVGPDDQDFYFLEDRTTANAAGRYATLTLNALAGLGQPAARP